MSIEKPNRPMPEEQIELNFAKPNFAELQNEFFELTGYKADGYGFTVETDTNELIKFLEELKKQPTDEERRGLLIGRVAEIEKDLDWRHK